MDDRALLQLLSEKSPEELSDAELLALRARLRESPELREALADRLQWEEFLVQSLSQVEVTGDQVRARRPGSPEAGLPIGWGGLLLCGLLVAFVAGVYVLAVRVRPHGSDPKVAQVAPPESPSAQPEPPVEPPAAPPAPLPPPESPAPAPPAAPPELPAAPEPPAAAAPPFVLRLPASSAVTQQAEARATWWGLQRVTTLVSAAANGFAEYAFEAPQTSKAELRVRHAHSKPFPVVLTLNGQRIAGAATLPATGGESPRDLRWTSLGEIPLRQGRNTLRMTGPEGLPHLLELSLATPGAMAENLGPPQRPGLPPWPWTTALTAAGEPPHLTEVALEPFNTKQSLPSREDLREWFAAVRNERTTFDQRDGYGGRMGRLEGIAQLRAPLRDDTLLRLALVDTNEWAWHIFAGDYGVTIAGRDGRLLAWSTLRDADAPRPRQFATTAGDEGRARRTDRDDDAFDIRWRQGEVIVSRGDIELLRAALLDPPTEVFFEGQANFRGLALVKVQGDLPAPFSPWGPSQVLQPASLDWQGSLRGTAKVTKEADGSIVLAGQAIGENESSWIAAPLPRKGLFAVELALEELTASPGFCLLGESPPNDDILRCGSDRDGKQFFFDRRWWEQKIDDAPRMTHNRLPLHAGGARQWIRIFVGPQLETTWISPDGIHWAQAPEPRRKETRDRSRIAICLPNRAGDSRVRVRQIVLRELAPLAHLADANLVQQAPCPNVENLGAWQLAIADAKPADVDLAQWRRACAVRLLGAGAPQALGYQVLDWLLDDVQLRNLPPEQERDALAAALLLADSPDFAEALNRVHGRLLELGVRLAAAGEAAPYSFLRRALLETPLHSGHRFDGVSDALVRHELLSRLSAGDAEGVRQLARQLAYGEQTGQVKLALWAHFAAAQLGGLSNVVGKPEWRHPLVEELSKETYNVLAEFQAVVDSNSPHDAARMIAQVEAHVASGLAPSGADRQLSVSVPVAFAAAMQRDPQLRAAMQEQFGPSAQLRVRQAISEGNPQAIELATVRYYGTEAAAEAHRWLGDRALSGGQFAIALHHYGRASETASPSLRGEIAPRARLAAAMLGRDQGVPVKSPVQLGDIRLSAAEFETLVAESRQGHLAAPHLARGRGTEDWSAGPAPPPTGFRSERRARLDGDRGNEPQSILHRHVRQFNIPWVERQIAITLSDHVAYVSNRFSVSAIDLTNGQRKWLTQPLAGLGGAGRAGEWPLVAMRPLVTEKFVYARLLGTRGPMLLAMQRDSGSVEWTAAPPDGESLVSDPLLRDDVLFVFTTRQPDQGDATLRLTQFDSRTGRLLGHQALTQVRDTWKERRMCEPTALDDGIAVNLGGATLCCDWSGRLRWIRRDLILPAEEEPHWVAQGFDRPLRVGETLILAQPGVRNVTAVDAATGSLLWRFSLPSIERLLGILDEKLIVRTGEGLVALEAKSGAVLWRCEIANLLEGQLVGGPGGIVVSRRMAGARVAQKGVPELLWIAANSGQIVHRAPLAELEENQPRFGPLFADGDKLFALAGKEPDDGFRDIVELAPQGAAEPAEMATHLPHFAQQRHLLPASLPLAVQTVLPGWGILACEPGEPLGLAGDIQGEPGSLALRARHSSPLILARVLPPGEPAKRLKIKVGFDAANPWRLSLRHNGRPVASQDYTQQSHPVFWREWEVEAPGGAPPGAELMLVAEPSNSGANAPIYFKRIELAP